VENLIRPPFVVTKFIVLLKHSLVKNREKATGHQATNIPRVSSKRGGSGNAIQETTRIAESLEKEAEKAFDVIDSINERQTVPVIEDHGVKDSSKTQYERGGINV
jgi:hypothetical protein